MKAAFAPLATFLRSKLLFPKELQAVPTAAAAAATTSIHSASSFAQTQSNSIYIILLRRRLRRIQVELAFTLNTSFKILVF